MEELQQKIDKKVWRAVHTFDLTALERKPQGSYPFLYVSEGQVHGLRDV
jgi:hypothetical protein